MKLQTQTSILLATAAQRDAFAFDPLTGIRLVPRDPWTCFVEGGDDLPPPAAGKTFSQEDIDRIVKTRLKKADAENAKLIARLDKSDKSSASTQEALEALQTKFDATNKSDVEKDLAKSMRTIAKLEAERAGFEKTAAEATATALAAVDGLQRTQLKSLVREGLRVSKAHGQGMDQAVELMLAGGAALDEEGAFGMTVDGVPYDKPAEAASKWLGVNSHFAEGSGGGSGHPRPGGNGKLVTPKQMDAMSPGALISQGLSEPAK